MRAGVITLRIDDLLVGIAGDTDAALDRCRAAFAEWIDDSRHDIEPAFDIRLTGSEGAGLRAVPQLRLGASVVARSRSADDVLAALDSILGTIRACRAQPSRSWTFLRPFVHGAQIVLVDARAPMLVNDPLLERAGIVEIPSWAVAVEQSDGAASIVLEVPPPLTGSDDHTARVGVARRFELVGVVAVADATAGGDGGGAGAVLARYGSRHASPSWFRALAALLDGDRFVAAPDRVAVRQAIGRLLATD